MFRIGNISNHTVDHGVGAGDEGLLNQSNMRVVKNPQAVPLVGAIMLIAFIGNTITVEQPRQDDDLQGRGINCACQSLPDLHARGHEFALPWQL